LNQYTVTPPLLLLSREAGLHATGVHCPAPVQLVPSGQRVMLDAAPSAAHVLIVLAVEHVETPGLQLGAMQLATPAN
jgi:hypothetical protein